MSDPAVARAFLISEVEGLEPFGFVAVAPSGNPLHLAEVTRTESGSLEVRVPGRMRPFPELEAAVRGKLRERGFATQDAADLRQPWAKGVPDAETAVNELQGLFVEVFGEKPEAKLDVGHGSHRFEHEARRKLEIARSRIQTIVADILGTPAVQDADGDFLLPIDDVCVIVAPRAAPTGQIVIRVFAITNVGVEVTPNLGLFLARLNFGLMFGRFALDAENRSIWFDESLLGEGFRDEELRFAVEIVSATADEWDDRLKQMFGGKTYQEVLAGRSAESPPPAKPGEGLGLYL